MHIQPQLGSERLALAIVPTFFETTVRGSYNNGDLDVSPKIYCALYTYFKMVSQDILETWMISLP